MTARRPRMIACTVGTVVGLINLLLIGQPPLLVIAFGGLALLHLALRWQA